MSIRDKHKEDNMTYHGNSHVQVVKMFGNSGSKNYPTCWLMKCNHWSSLIPWSRAIPRRFDRLAAQISPRCGANCALRRQAGQSLVAQGSTVYHIKSIASSNFNFTIFLQVEFVSVFQFFQLESITLTNSQKTRLFVIFGAWVVKFCQIIQAESSVDQVGTAWQSSFATLERQGANNQGWLPHSNWKAT